MVEKSDVSLTLLESSSSSTFTSTVYSDAQITVTQALSSTSSSSTYTDDSHSQITSTQGQSSMGTNFLWEIYGISSTTSTDDSYSQIIATNGQTSTGSVATSSTSFLASASSKQMEPPDRDVSAKTAVFSVAQCLALTWIVFSL